MPRYVVQAVTYLTVEADSPAQAVQKHQLVIRAGYINQSYTDDDFHITRMGAQELP